VNRDESPPAAADDTSNLLAGTPLDALLNGGAPAAGFSIDYERLPQAIADLEHAAKFFEDRAKVAQSLAKISPPGIDGVSINAIAQIEKWASDDGVNNLEASLLAGSKQLKALAKKLREELKAYLGVEELNIPKPTPGLPL
jgi:hypothetical protein